MAGLLRHVERWYSIPLLLLVWQAAVSSGLVESRLLPGLGRVVAALVRDTSDGALPYHTAVTLGRAAAGFALAALAGVPFAAAMARSTLIRNLFEPIFFFGYPVPKIALFPVFTYMFGLGSPSKIAFAFLECLYPIVVTAYLGFRAIPVRLCAIFGIRAFTVIAASSFSVLFAGNPPRPTRRVGRPMRTIRRHPALDCTSNSLVSGWTSKVCRVYRVAGLRVNSSVVFDSRQQSGGCDLVGPAIFREGRLCGAMARCPRLWR